MLNFITQNLAKIVYMNITPLTAALLLHTLPGLGPVRIKKLINHFGSPEKVWGSPPNKWLAVKGIGEKHSFDQALVSPNFDRIKKEEKFILDQGIQAIYYGHPQYPKTLAFISDPPPVCFYKGKVDWSNPRIISIVGTRKPTQEGIDQCRKLIRGLTPYRPIIVSGLAYGIDVCAHQIALEQGLETVACLGHGFQTLYPQQHKKIAQKIMTQGALFTEFWSDAPFERSNFLQRNHIIAGLAHLTLVIESGTKGGSMVTAYQAFQYGREVFALPGRLSDPKSQGCLQLIQREQARIITSAEALAEWMGWENKGKKLPEQKELFVSLTNEEHILFEALLEPKSLDQLAEQLTWSVAKTAAHLLQMELKGCIKSEGPKRFKRLY